MRKVHITWFLGLLFLPSVILASTIIGPTETPTGQYHPLEEIYVSSSPIDWKGVDFTNINQIDVVFLNVSNGISYPYTNPSGIYVASNQGDAISAYTNVAGKSAVYGIAGNSNAWAGYFEGGKGLFATVIESNTTVTARSFVDKDNNAYYVDPDATSIINSITIQGTIIHPDSGTLWQTDNDHVKITFHDGCGNFQIMAGATGCPNTYVSNSGAAEIELQYDFGGNGAIYLRVAPAGTAGNSITWTTYTFSTTEFNSPLQLKAPKLVDRDNTAYYVDPSATSSLNTLIIANVPAITDNNKVLTVDASGQVSSIDTTNWDKDATDDITTTNIASYAVTSLNTLTGDIQVQAGTGISISTNSTTNTITITNTGDTDPTDDITGSGTSGYLPKFTGTKTIGNSIVYDTGTSVGIGTTSPGAKLHVNGGGIRITNGGERIDIGWEANNPAIELRDTDGTGLTPYIDFSNDGTVDYDMRIILTGDNELTVTGGNLKVAGNVIPSVSNTYDVGSSANMWRIVYASKICLNSACTAVIYWNASDGTLYILAPNIIINSTG